MLTMLVAYDTDGNVIATLGHMVARDVEGHALGLVDFEAHESAGGRLRDVWDVQGAAGSGTWPEWLASRAHEFKVELSPDKRITALVHATSGHRRERTVLEAAIAAVQPDEEGRRDIRHLVGGPNRPLVLDDQGKTVGRTVVSGTPAHLPVFAGRSIEAP